MSDKAHRFSALRWLIVGADGLIGRHLYVALQLNGAHVLGTSRRWGSQHAFLDLAAEPETWELPEADVVVIAAAVSRIADCEADEITTAKINTQGPVELAKRVWEQGGFVVFISSSGVFDGASDVPTIAMPTCPLNAYGRQKAAAELALMQAAEGRYGLSIIRPTKTLGSDTPILREWQAALAQGQSIHPHAWRWMAPVAVAWAVRAILIIAAAREPGIWHLSSASDVNFAEFARRWVSARGWPTTLVQAEEQEGATFQRARLDMSATTKRFSVVAPTLDDTIAGLQGVTA